jgi:hypothetical protein
MKYITPLFRGALAACLAVQLMSACGGQSFSSEGDNGGSAAGGSSSTTGGKSATTGGSSSSTAGKGSSTGGRPGTGGAVGTGGSTSAGGSPGTGGSSTTGGEECNAPAETGNCEAAMPRWFHDPSTGVCRPFTYGGCGGNANNYQSLEDCQKACHGGSPNYDACKQPSDCVVTGTGCCGVCDHPGLTAHDFIAYGHEHANKVLDCGAVDIACAPCAPVADGARKYFVPSCVRGECVVEDIRESDVTACDSAMDCKLRNGAGCCEGCGGGEVIAVRNDGSFEKLVCGGEPQPCPACFPVPSEKVTATCRDGRCAVVPLPI